MNKLEQLAKENGFESLEEFNKLISSKDISTEEKMRNFIFWRSADGTKQGLLKLPEAGTS